MLCVWLIFAITMCLVAAIILTVLIMTCGSAGHVVTATAPATRADWRLCDRFVKLTAPMRVGTADRAGLGWPRDMEWQFQCPKGSWFMGTPGVRGWCLPGDWTRERAAKHVCRQNPPLRGQVQPPKLPATDLCYAYDRWIKLASPVTVEPGDAEHGDAWVEEEPNSRPYCPVGAFFQPTPSNPSISACYKKPATQSRCDFFVHSANTTTAPSKKDVS